MDVPTTTEQQVKADIERLREQFPETQDLYRETCVLLFFRYGIAPTANKLYQLVRKGSMNAPAEALAKFWDNLREKSRVKIEHPDLPDELKTIAGEMVSSIWNHAQRLANESLASQREAADARVEEAQAAQKMLEAERNDALKAMQLAQDAGRRAEERARDLDQRLAAESAAKQAAEAQLRQASGEIDRLQSMSDAARREFAAELEKQRESAALAEERFHASHARALQEIDRERTIAARLQKDLEQVRASADEAAARHRTDAEALHTAIGELRQQAGMLEGSLREAVQEKNRLAVDLDAIRSQLTDALSRNSVLQSDVDTWRTKASRLSTRLRALTLKGVRAGGAATES